MLITIKLIVLAGALLAVNTDLQNAQANSNMDASALVQQHCASCHSLSKDQQALVGPVLHDIVGSPAARDADFDYSRALLDKASAGLIWDTKTLDQFLFSPAGTVPGTKMTFPGIADAAVRQQIIRGLSNPELLASAESPIPGGGTTTNPDIERILAISADSDYGEYLAGECVTCHAGSNTNGGVPSINELPSHYFVQAMIEYKKGQRENPVMRLMAGNLGDEELAALAAFFAEQ